MSDKPVLSVLQNVGADGTYLLSRINQTKIELRALFSNSVVNLAQILIIFFRKQVMSFFKVKLDKVVGLIGNEPVHTFFKDLSADPFGVKILNAGIALREVDDDDSTAT